MESGERVNRSVLEMSAIQNTSNNGGANVSTFYASQDLAQPEGTRHNDTSLSFHQISLSTVGGAEDNQTGTFGNKVETARADRSTNLHQPPMTVIAQRSRRALVPPAPSPQKITASDEIAIAKSQSREPTNTTSGGDVSHHRAPFADTEATALMERLTKQRRSSPNRSAANSYPDKHPQHNSNSPTAKLLTDRRILNESNVYDTSVAYSTAEEAEDKPEGATNSRKIAMVSASQFRPPPALPAASAVYGERITSSIYASAGTVQAQAADEQPQPPAGYASNDKYRKALLARIVQQRNKQREVGSLRERVFPSTAPEQPKLKRTSSAKPEEFIKRMKEKGAQSKHDQLIRQHEQELREVAECTFAPAINKAPPPNPNHTQPMIDDDKEKHYTKDTVASEVARAAAAAQRMQLAERAHQRQQEIADRIARHRSSFGGEEEDPQMYVGVRTSPSPNSNRSSGVAAAATDSHYNTTPQRREEYSRTRSPHRADGNVATNLPYSPAPTLPGHKPQQPPLAPSGGYYPSASAAKLGRIASSVRSASQRGGGAEDGTNVTIDFDRMSGRYSTHMASPVAKWGRRASLTRSESSTIVDIANCTFQPYVAPTSKNVYRNGTRKVEGSLDTFTRLYSRSASFQSQHPEHAAKLAQEEAERNEFRRTASAGANISSWGMRGPSPIVLASPSASEAPGHSTSPARGSSAVSFQDPTNLLRHGAPEQQWAAHYILNRLPVALSTELETVRTEAIAGALTDEELLSPTLKAPIALEECSQANAHLPPTHPTMLRLARKQSTPAYQQHALMVPPHFMLSFLCNVLDADSARDIQAVGASAHVGMMLADDDSKGQQQQQPVFDMFQLCDGDQYFRNKMKAEIAPATLAKPRRLFARYASNTTEGGDQSPPPTHNGKGNGSVSVDMTSFIRRQEAMQKSRERRHLELVARHAPSHKPQLSSTTVALFAKKSSAEAKGRGDKDEDQEEAAAKENKAPEDDRKRTNSNARKATAGEEQFLQQFGRSHSAPKMGKIEPPAVSYFNKRSPSELAKPKALPTKHYDENLTFRPIISEFAHSQAAGYGHDRLHADAKTRQKRIETLREEAIKRERTTVATFKPKTNQATNAEKYGNVQSLLAHRNLNSDAYKAHLTRSKQIHEAKLAVKESAEDEDDLRECTFRPVINKTPSYIAQMSNGYALMRAMI